MLDLRDLGQQVVDKPLRSPTPLSSLQDRIEARGQRRQRLFTRLSVVAAMLLVVMLAGIAVSGGGDEGSSNAATATTTAAGHMADTVPAQPEREADDRSDDPAPLTSIAAALLAVAAVALAGAALLMWRRNRSMWWA